MTSAARGKRRSSDNVCSSSSMLEGFKNFYKEVSAWKKQKEACSASKKAEEDAEYETLLRELLDGGVDPESEFTEYVWMREFQWQKRSRDKWQIILQVWHWGVGEDQMIWKLNKSGVYTSRSLYRLLMDSGVVDSCVMKIWEARMPAKIKKKFWMAWKNRIQRAEQLVVRKWKGSEFCKLCGLTESTDHLIFCCPVARAVWCWVRDALGWSRVP
ncbi:hypothetical protein U9M48_034851, partial [Paspalum notatum var. saurae]